MLYKWISFLSFCALFLCQESFSVTQHNIRAMAKESIENFKLKLHQKLVELTMLRESSTPGKKLQPIIHAKPVDINSEDMKLACVAHRGESQLVFGVTSSNVLTVLKNFTFIPIKKIPLERAFISLQALEYGNAVLLIAHHTNRRKRHFIKEYLYGFGNLERVQKIPIAGPSLISSTKMGHTVYTAVASINALHREFRLYQYTRTFDSILEEHLDNNCSALAIWTNDDAVYVALSFTELRIVEIKRHIKYSGNMHIVQILDIEASVLKYFEDDGNNYLACGTTDSIVIYWWTGSSFRQTQTILFDKNIQDIAIHNLLGRNVLASLLSGEVKILVRGYTAQYEIAETISFNEIDNMKNILLWKSGRSLFMLSSSGGTNSAYVHELSLEFRIADHDEKPELTECVKSVQDHLKVNKQKRDVVNSAVERMSSLSESLETAAKSLKNLNDIAEELFTKTEKVQAGLATSIFRTGDQYIDGEKKFKYLTIPNVTIEELSDHITLNSELKTSSFPFLLKKSGNQVFEKSIVVSNVSTQQANVHLLNGKDFKDYMLLNGRCIATGEFTFGSISASSLFVNHTVNKLPLEDLILTNKEQDIEGNKTFVSLSSDTIWTKKFNDKISLDELKELPFIKSSRFTSSLNFTSDLMIEGNLTVNLLNSFDPFQLFTNITRKNAPEEIFGEKTFKSLIIKGHLTVQAKLNNISFDNLMTTKTDQIIQGELVFSHSTAFQNIATDSINKIDLSEQAVVRSRNSTVEGVKTFTENIDVSHISMKDGVLIDKYDPSMEVSTLILKFKNGGGVEMGNVTFENMTITNIEVDADYFPLLKELDNVWLRSKEQAISLLKTENISVSELQVSKINNLTVDDFVLVKDNTTINGSVHFVEGVLANTLKSEKIVNTTFPTSFGAPDIKIRILNNITIDNAVLDKNLYVNSTIENFESGFLHAKEEQTLEGETVFENVTIKDDVYQESNVNIKNLNFQYFNKIDFTDFLGQAVVFPGNRTINKKRFRLLKGTDLQCDGTLNNVSLDKIFMTNSKQTISSAWSFLEAPSFKKVVVNNFFDNITLRNVVYKDEVGSLSNKHFTKITANQINTSGIVNGINITNLQLKYFSKSVDTVMEEMLTIQKNIETTKIHVNGSKIDGVDLEDVILTKNLSNIEHLKGSSFVAENINLTGKLNSCEWMDVLENSLLSQSGSQTVTSNVTVTSLVITGNMKVNCINGAKIPDWISLMTFYSTSTLQGDFHFENLSVGSLNLPNLVNNISLNFLMNDAVKNNLLQDINGVKEFEYVAVENITIKNATIKTLNSNSTFGVNVSDITEYFVNRNGGNQTVYLENRILGGLDTNRVVIKGNLNNLTLPANVILINTSEVIDAEVEVYGNLTASAGIALSKINGIDIENFLQNRVTLHTSQVMESSMNFTDDIHFKGNVVINGTLNDIDLKKVVKKVHNQTVTGVKNFTEGLEVKTDLFVNGTINEMHLENFLWSTRNETLKDVTLSQINTSSMIVGRVNGIEFNNIYNDTLKVVEIVNDKLYNSTVDIQSFDESLRFQRDAIENSLSLFNYFELHEICTYRKNSAQKFLPVYEYGIPGEKYELQTTKMVMWITNIKSNKRTKSLIADLSSSATFKVTRTIQGKVFPFSLKVEREGVVGFYVQAEHSQRYSNGSKSNVVINTLHSSGNVEERTILLPADATLFDVQLLELHDVFLIIACNVKGSSERIIIYQFDPLNNSWSDHQDFHHQDLTSLNLVTVDRDSGPLADPQSVYLSVTSDEKNPGIFVYEWDFEIDEFYLKSNISTTVSSYAQWIHNDGTLYLLLAKENIKIQQKHSTVKVFNEPVEVYTLEEELILNHSVDIKGVCSLETFKLADEVYVLASSNHMNTVYVLQFRGYNGFEVIQEIPAPGITEARVFNVDDSIYLALNSKTGYSRILKASVRGRRLEDD